MNTKIALIEIYSSLKAIGTGKKPVYQSFLIIGGMDQKVKALYYNISLDPKPILEEAQIAFFEYVEENLETQGTLEIEYYSNVENIEKFYQQSIKAVELARLCAKKQLGLNHKIGKNKNILDILKKPLKAIDYEKAFYTEDWEKLSISDLEGLDIGIGETTSKKIWKSAKLIGSEEINLLNKNHKEILANLGSSKLSKQQTQAFYQIKNWLEQSNKPIMTLSGYAGTGKTYLIRYIYENIGLDPYEIAVMAYTGKAALNLTAAAIPAKTASKSLYIYKNIEERDHAQKSIKIVERTKEYNLYGVKLIIIDEASMMPDEMIADIRTHSPSTKILLVGDKAQLPPVKNTSHFVNTVNYDAELTEVHRQSLKSGIIKIATLIRGEHTAFNQIRNTLYDIQKEKNLKDVKVMGTSEIIPYITSGKLIQDYDQVLTFTNDVRSILNPQLRESYYKYIIEDPKLLAKLDSTERERTFLNHERVICRQNNYFDTGTSDYFLLNGMVGSLYIGDPAKIHKSYNFITLEKNNIMYYIKDSHFFFNQLYQRGKDYKVDHNTFYLDEVIHIDKMIALEEKIRYYRKAHRGKHNLNFNGIRVDSNRSYFDYSYAITTHVSQGSEWDRVALFFPLYSKGDLLMKDKENFKKWLYTAVTRAKKELIIFLC